MHTFARLRLGPLFGFFHRRPNYLTGSDPGTVR